MPGKREVLSEVSRHFHYMCDLLHYLGKKKKTKRIRKHYPSFTDDEVDLAKVIKPTANHRDLTLQLTAKS